MKAELPISLDDLKFSREAIDQQVQKIFLDPFFINSDILRKFLTFIIDQTLAGHADWLKEYTIGINVLNKSADFKPQDNGIVRIHAGRLRRALHNYYKNMGAYDPIRVTIPKGRYVPLFTENVNTETNNELNVDANILVDASSAIATRKPEVIAVLPFQHFHNDSLENSLIDGLGLQLTNALMQFEKYSVIAHYTVRDLWKKTTDLSDLASFADIKYILSGCIQTIENKVRLHIQMINLHNGMQVWSCMYEGEFASDNIFKLQDQMVQFIISELIKSRKFIDDKIKLTALVAVA
jgi:TolB-like protein